jgi:putative FmdB family regulatory protein
MPTYEYECKSCGYSFDAFQSMSDEPLRDCPRCGKEVRRLINGGSGIIFKGSGFYVTDKKGSGAAPAKAAETAAKPPDSSTPSGAKDSGGSGSSAPANSGTGGSGTAASTERSAGAVKKTPAAEKKAAG